MIIISMTFLNIPPTFHKGRHVSHLQGSTFRSIFCCVRDKKNSQHANNSYNTTNDLGCVRLIRQILFLWRIAERQSASSGGLNHKTFVYNGVGLMCRINASDTQKRRGISSVPSELQVGVFLSPWKWHKCCSWIINGSRMDQTYTLITKLK